jgi:MFS family permease
VVVPLSGWLGNRIGLTRLYTMCLLGFAGASALCGLAGNLDTLIAFRILQAVPGGVLPVITMTILYQIVPRAQIGAAMGVYGLGVVFAPAVGPTLGGYLVEYTNWRLIFYINVPVGILGAMAVLAVFPRIHPTSWPKFDFWGFLTIGYGLFALLLATSKPVHHPVLHPAVPAGQPGTAGAQRRPGAAALGTGHGGVGADRRAALRQDRATLAGGDRAAVHDVRLAAARPDHHRHPAR